MTEEMTDAPIVERLAPLDRADWPPEMADAMKVMAANRPRTAEPPRPDQPRGGNVLGTFAHHPRLAQAYFHFSSYLLAHSTLLPRERELVILRIAAVRRAPYEWAQHVHLGRGSGLTDSEIERVIAGPDARGWSVLDQHLLRAVDELIADARIADATWTALSEAYDTRQIVDLVFTIGAYELLAMAFNSFGVPLDEDLRDTVPRLRD